MNVLSALLAFFKALPDLLKLIQTLQARIDEAGIERHVAEDVKTINDAFNQKDATKLNSLFNSK